MLVPGMARVTQQEPKAESQSITATAQVPTLDLILDKYIQAVGGKAAIEKLTSRIIKGSLITSGGNAPVEIYEKAPDKFLVITNSAVTGVSQNGFNGAVAWSQNSQRGLREMSGPEVENFKREYDLHKEIRLKELYPRRTVKGSEKVGNREAHVVETVTRDGISEAMYFDVGTGLLVRRDVTLQGTTSKRLSGRGRPVR